MQYIPLKLHRFMTNTVHIGSVSLRLDNNIHVFVVLRPLHKIIKRLKFKDYVSVLFP
jgi:hypothetical protein